MSTYEKASVYATLNCPLIVLKHLGPVGAQAEFFSIRSGSKSEYVLTCKKTGSKTTPYKCTHGRGQVMFAFCCLAAISLCKCEPS